ncbi:MAG: hypothetical protein AB7Q81_03470 [Gammaproteobacteria bacterium]
MAESAPHLEILVPDLLPALTAAASPTARGVAAVLARADFSSAHWPGLETALLDACGIAWQGDASPPLAAAAARLDLDGLPSGAVMLRADPVHLRADPTRLVLFDAASLDVTAAEADTLIADLNAHFAADGITLRRGPVPHRWYLAWPAAPAVPSASPRSLRGVPLEPDQAMRRGLGELRRVLTEMQMVLHDSTANHARLAAGKPPVNSVWPWGWGELPAPHRTVPTALVGSDGELDVVAAHVGAQHDPDPARLDAVLAATAGDVVVVFAVHAAAGAATDWPAVFEIAVAALRGGRVAGLTVATAHGRFVLTRGAARRWWRRPASFLARWQALLAAAETP